MRMVGLLLAIVLLGGISHESKADSVVDNFVVCDSCVQASDFAAAARIWYGTIKKTPEQVTVGNTETGILYTMWVGPSGRIPYIIRSQSALDGSGVIIQSSNPNVIRAAQLTNAPFGVGQPVVSSEMEDTQHEPMFRGAVAAYKNDIIFNVTPSQEEVYGDVVDSFSDAIGGMERTSPLIWAEEQAHNPLFEKSAWGLWDAIKHVLDSAFGHGILVTIVFKNGDVATFQINIADSDATRYVSGTAKDRFGHSLPNPGGGIGGGSGAGGAHVINNGGADLTDYSIGEDQDEEWLVCTYVGGVLQGCYVTTEPE